MKNIAVLTKYVDELEEKYGKESGSIRVILSEQGYNAGKGADVQARAIAQGYYMAEFNERIDAFIIRAVIDAAEEAEGGLFLGIMNRYEEKRTAFYIYEYMDSDLQKFIDTPANKISTSNEKKVAAAQEILRDLNWEKIIPGFNRERLAAMH